ncbi:MAG: hypothetical protein Q8M20_15550 [Rhodocyclaceae bacterium]|nr:hypothetical protein [Rhodocyclaceae bacterium]MDZ4215083.1 hypothetical protein [Rhodocyclaceae bacterium]
MLPFLAAQWLWASAVVLANDKDPTVPPAVWLAVQPSVAGDQVVQTGDAARVRVLVVGKSRRLALVDGHVVQAGDAVGDSKVAAIGGGRWLWKMARKRSA